MINFIETPSPIKICDIGAIPIDSTNFIDELFENTNSELIGFEPNINEFQRLKKHNKKKYYLLIIEFFKICFKSRF